MFVVEDFDFSSSEEALSNINVYKGFDKNASQEDVVKAIDALAASVSVLYNPKFILRKFFVLNGDNSINGLRFSIQPTSKYKVEGLPVKKSFFIEYVEGWHTEFIKNMHDFFMILDEMKMLRSNLNELNSRMKKVTDKAGLDWELEFTIGSGIISATDSKLVFGLGVEFVKNLDKTSLFSVRSVFDSSASDQFEDSEYEESIVDMLKGLERNYDIATLKSKFTVEYNIYRRQPFYKRVISSVGRGIDLHRLGVMYVDQDDYFAVIEKVAVSEKELAESDTDSYVVVDNVELSKGDVGNGKELVVAHFVLSPFNKATGDKVNVSLGSIVNK